jgi:leucyl/phenylalanyl-tRNA--protein transferase
MRGVLPLDRFHVSRSLRKVIRRDVFEIRIDTAFSRVMEFCAEAAPNRPNTWINASILNLYSSLHRAGYAHSVEAWRDGELVGGLYGVSLRAAFFGESMFSRATSASKVALAHLVARLRAGGYRLLDTQFVTGHLETFGVEEVPRENFHVLLRDALKHEAEFGTQTYCGAEALQLITQTS